MKIKVDYCGKIELGVNDIAGAMAELSSDDFGFLMSVFTDRLLFKCGSEEKMQAQECWIASQLPDDAIKFFKSVVEFIKLNEEKKS